MRAVSNLSWVLIAAVTGSIIVGSVDAEGLSPFYDIRDYGAVPNDDVKDTEAIRKAIAGAVHAGGGTVYIPAGRFVSGSIHLRSHITLHLDASVVLAFSPDFDDYLPMVPSRWEGTECANFSPPTCAYRAEMPVENVTFSNIDVEAEKGLSCSNAKNMVFRNVRIATKNGPALICENVQDLEIEGFRTLTSHGDSAVIDLKNVGGAYLHGCRATAKTDAFLRLRGENCRDVFLQGNDLRAASTAVQTAEGCPDSALIQD